MRQTVDIALTLGVLCLLSGGFLIAATSGLIRDRPRPPRRKPPRPRRHWYAAMFDHAGRD